MANRILVAVSDCNAEEYLLNKTISIAQAKKDPVELLFLHVILDGKPYDESMAASLQTWVERAKAANLKAVSRIEYGLPGRIICQQASYPLWNANLIVVGHHTRNALIEAALGSVSSYVREHTPINCAVLVVCPQIKASAGGR